MELLSLLMAATGDDGKPLLIAICLIVSVVLMVVMIVTGKSASNSEDTDVEEDTEE